MFEERLPMETQPVIEVVSGDVTLPVIESSVIDRTKQQYTAMDLEQKRDFKLAVLSTFGGMALTAAAYVVERQAAPSKLPTVLRTAGYTLDYVDGYFAKRSASSQSPGAVTEFGALADPLADKFNNTINEIALVRRGRLSPVDLAVRALRDTGVTATRRFVTKKSKGKVDARANTFGKLNTVIRDGVNLFASTDVAAKHPRLNRRLQTGANIYSVASGVYTTAQLIKAMRKDQH